MNTHNSLKVLSFVSIFTLLTAAFTLPSFAAIKKTSSISVGVSVVSSCKAAGMVRLRNGACVPRG